MLINYALSLISIARENGAEIIFLSACCCVLNEKRAQYAFYRTPGSNFKSNNTELGESTNRILFWITKDDLVLCQEMLMEEQPYWIKGKGWKKQDKDSVQTSTMQQMSAPEHRTHQILQQQQQ